MRCSPDTFLKVRIPNEFENLYTLSLVFAKTLGWELRLTSMPSIGLCSFFSP